MKKHFFLILVFLITFSCADHIVESVPMVLDGKLRAKFSILEEQVLTPSCAKSGCHIGNAQFPDLSKGKAYNNMINLSSRQDTSLRLIQPNSSNDSYLYLKIIGSSRIKRSRMPPGSSKLKTSILDSFRVWINTGALNN